MPYRQFAATRTGAMLIVARNVYETLFILDSNQYARDSGGLSKTLSEMIEKIDGKVLASRLWVEQKLAFPVEGHQKGAYWLMYFEAESSSLVGFYRDCQLNEAILRQMTLKIDSRLVEPMVAHARGEAVAAPAEGETAEEAGSDSEAPKQVAVAES